MAERSAEAIGAAAGAGRPANMGAESTRGWYGRFRRARGSLIGLVSLALGLVVWDLYARSRDTFIPPIGEVVDAWVKMASSGELPQALLLSGETFLIGLVLAFVVALAFGLLIGLSDEADHAVAPLLSALVALPSVAYIPLIMIWLGFGLEGRVAVVFEFAVLVMTLNFRAGIRSVDPDLLEMARSFRFGRWLTFRRIILPGAMAGIMAGIRLGLGRAIKGTVTAEVLLVLVGVGGLVKSYGNTFRVDSLLAVVMTIIVIALVLTSLLLWLDARINGWRRFAQRDAGGSH